MRHLARAESFLLHPTLFRMLPPLCHFIISYTADIYRTPRSNSFNILLLPSECKRVLHLLPWPSPRPDILAIRLRLQRLLLFRIPLLYQAFLDLWPRVAVLCPHAKPEIVPVIAATAQLPIAVQVVEVPAERAAVEGGVKGGAAGHGAREGGVELFLLCGWSG